MNSLKIRIKKDNIINAIKENSHRCMIADAIQKEIPGAKFISVDVQSIRFTNKKTSKRYIYLTPPSAQHALIQFDKGKKINPFSFTISQGLVRTMRIRQGKFKRSDKRYKKTKRYMPKIIREYGLRAITK